MPIVYDMNDFSQNETRPQKQILPFTPIWVRGGIQFVKKMSCRVFGKKREGEKEKLVSYIFLSFFFIDLDTKKVFKKTEANRKSYAVY